LVPCRYWCADRSGCGGQAHVPPLPLNRGGEGSVHRLQRGGMCRQW
jgi:hypothetical protein